MFNYLKQHKHSFKFRMNAAALVVCFLAVSLFGPGSAYAQTFQPLNLPVAGSMVPLSPAFTPLMIKGITVHPENPLEFDFIIDKGDQEFKDDAAYLEESRRQVKYFLTSLTVPENELWVNLSPYEKDKIVPQSFGQTEMGRDALAQDYLLKQLTATLMYPEEKIGREVWQQIYQRLADRFGTTQLAVNTFNKVWIVPEKATVFEKGTHAFVVESRLKVMLEEDYFARDSGLGARGSPIESQATNHESLESNKISKDIIKTYLIPEIEKEINEGKNFARIRQIFNALILADWYKKNLKENLLSKVYVDQNKTRGIELDDKEIKQKIYSQYIDSFKKGVFNYIKEDYDPALKENLPRKYFSGGVEMLPAGFKITTTTSWSPGPAIVSSPLNIEQLTVKLVDFTNRNWDRAKDIAKNVLDLTGSLRPAGFSMRITSDDVDILNKFPRFALNTVSDFLKEAGLVVSEVNQKLLDRFSVPSLNVAGFLAAATALSYFSLTGDASAGTFFDSFNLTTNPNFSLQDLAGLMPVFFGSGFISPVEPRPVRDEWIKPKKIYMTQAIIFFTTFIVGYGFLTSPFNIAHFNEPRNEALSVGRGPFAFLEEIKTNDKIRLPDGTSYIPDRAEKPEVRAWANQLTPLYLYSQLTAELTHGDPRRRISAAESASHAGDVFKPNLDMIRTLTDMLDLHETPEAKKAALDALNRLGEIVFTVGTFKSPQEFYEYYRSLIDQATPPSFDDFVNRFPELDEKSTWDDILQPGRDLWQLPVIKRMIRDINTNPGLIQTGKQMLEEFLTEKGVSKSTTNLFANGILLIPTFLILMVILKKYPNLHKRFRLWYGDNQLHHQTFIRAFWFLIGAEITALLVLMSWPKLSENLQYQLSSLISDQRSGTNWAPGTTEITTDPLQKEAQTTDQTKVLDYTLPLFLYATIASHDHAYLSLIKSGLSSLDTENAETRLNQKVDHYLLTISHLSETKKEFMTFFKQEIGSMTGQFNKKVDEKTVLMPEGLNSLSAPKKRDILLKPFAAWIALKAFQSGQFRSPEELETLGDFFWSLRSMPNPQSTDQDGGAIVRFATQIASQIPSGDEQSAKIWKWVVRQVKYPRDFTQNPDIAKDMLRLLEAGTASLVVIPPEGSPYIESQIWPNLKNGKYKFEFYPVLGTTKNSDTIYSQMLSPLSSITQGYLFGSRVLFIEGSPAEMNKIASQLRNSLGKDVITIPIPQEQWTLLKAIIDINEKKYKHGKWASSHLEDAPATQLASLLRPSPDGIRVSFKDLAASSALDEVQLEESTTASSPMTNLLELLSSPYFRFKMLIKEWKKNKAEEAESRKVRTQVERATDEFRWERVFLAAFVSLGMATGISGVARTVDQVTAVLSGIVTQGYSPRDINSALSHLRTGAATLQLIRYGPNTNLAFDQSGESGDLSGLLSTGSTAFMEIDQFNKFGDVSAGRLAKKSISTYKEIMGIVKLSTSTRPEHIQEFFNGRPDLLNDRFKNQLLQASSETNPGRQFDLVRELAQDILVTVTGKFYANHPELINSKVRNGWHDTFMTGFRQTSAVDREDLVEAYLWIAPFNIGFTYKGLSADEQALFKSILWRLTDLNFPIVAESAEALDILRDDNPARFASMMENRDEHNWFWWLTLTGVSGLILTFLFNSYRPKGRVYIASQISPEYPQSVPRGILNTLIRLTDTKRRRVSETLLGVRTRLRMAAEELAAQEKSAQQGVETQGTNEKKTGWLTKLLSTHKITSEEVFARAAVIDEIIMERVKNGTLNENNLPVVFDGVAQKFPGRITELIEFFTSESMTSVNPKIADLGKIVPTLKSLLFSKEIKNTDGTLRTLDFDDPVKLVRALSIIEALRQIGTDEAVSVIKEIFEIRHPDMREKMADWASLDASDLKGTGVEGLTADQLFDFGQGKKAIPSPSRANIRGRQGTAGWLIEDKKRIYYSLVLFALHAVIEHELFKLTERNDLFFRQNTGSRTSVDVPGLHPGLFDILVFSKPPDGHRFTLKSAGITAQQERRATGSPEIAGFRLKDKKKGGKSTIAFLSAQNRKITIQPVKRDALVVYHVVVADNPAATKDRELKEDEPQPGRLFSKELASGETEIKIKIPDNVLGQPLYVRAFVRDANGSGWEEGPITRIPTLRDHVSQRIQEITERLTIWFEDITKTAFNRRPGSQIKPAEITAPAHEMKIFANSITVGFNAGGGSEFQVVVLDADSRYRLETSLRDVISNAARSLAIVSLPSDASDEEDGVSSPITNSQDIASSPIIVLQRIRQAALTLPFIFLAGCGTDSSTLGQNPRRPITAEAAIAARVLTSERLSGPAIQKLWAGFDFSKTKPSMTPDEIINNLRVTAQALSTTTDANEYLKKYLDWLEKDGQGPNMDDAIAPALLDLVGKSDQKSLEDSVTYWLWRSESSIVKTALENILLTGRDAFRVAHAARILGKRGEGEDALLKVGQDPGNDLVFNAVVAAFIDMLGDRSYFEKSDLLTLVNGLASPATLGDKEFNTIEFEFGSAGGDNEPSIALKSNRETFASFRKRTRTTREDNLPRSEGPNRRYEQTKWGPEPVDVTFTLKTDGFLYKFFTRNPDVGVRNLTRLLREDMNPQHKMTILKALGATGSPSALNLILKAMEYNSISVQLAAFDAAQQFADKLAAYKALKDQYDDLNPSLPMQVLNEMWNIVKKSIQRAGTLGMHGAAYYQTGRVVSKDSTSFVTDPRFAQIPVTRTKYKTNGETRNYEITASAGEFGRRILAGENPYQVTLEEAAIFTGTAAITTYLMPLVPYVLQPFVNAITAEWAVEERKEAVLDAILYNPDPTQLYRFMAYLFSIWGENDQDKIEMLLNFTRVDDPITQALAFQGLKDAGYDFNAAGLSSILKTISLETPEDFFKADWITLALGYDGSPSAVQALEDRFMTALDHPEDRFGFVLQEDILMALSRIASLGPQKDAAVDALTRISKALAQEAASGDVGSHALLPEAAAHLRAIQIEFEGKPIGSQIAAVLEQIEKSRAEAEKASPKSGYNPTMISTGVFEKPIPATVWVTKNPDDALFKQPSYVQAGIIRDLDRELKRSNKDSRFIAVLEAFATRGSLKIRWMALTALRAHPMSYLKLFGQTIKNLPSLDKANLETLIKNAGRWADGSADDYGIDFYDQGNNPSARILNTKQLYAQALASGNVPAELIQAATSNNYPYFVRYDALKRLSRLPGWLADQALIEIATDKNDLFSDIAAAELSSRLNSITDISRRGPIINAIQTSLGRNDHLSLTSLVEEINHNYIGPMAARINPQMGPAVRFGSGALKTIKNTVDELDALHQLWDRSLSGIIRDNPQASDAAGRLLTALEAGDSIPLKERLIENQNLGTNSVRYTRYTESGKAAPFTHEMNALLREFILRVVMGSDSDQSAAQQLQNAIRNSPDPNLKGILPDTIRLNAGGDIPAETSRAPLREATKKNLDFFNDPISWENFKSTLDAMIASGINPYSLKSRFQSLLRTSPAAQVRANAANGLGRLLNPRSRDNPSGLSIDSKDESLWLDLVRPWFKGDDLNVQNAALDALKEVRVNSHTLDQLSRNSEFSSILQHLARLSSTGQLSKPRLIGARVIPEAEILKTLVPFDIPQKGEAAPDSRIVALAVQYALTAAGLETGQYQAQNAAIELMTHSDPQIRIAAYEALRELYDSQTTRRNVNPVRAHHALLAAHLRETSNSTERTKADDALKNVKIAPSILLPENGFDLVAETQFLLAALNPKQSSNAEIDAVLSSYGADIIIGPDGLENLDVSKANFLLDLMYDRKDSVGLDVVRRRALAKDQKTFHELYLQIRFLLSPIFKQINNPETPDQVKVYWMGTVEKYDLSTRFDSLQEQMPPEIVSKPDSMAPDYGVKPRQAFETPTKKEGEKVQITGQDLNDLSPGTGHNHKVLEKLDQSIADGTFPQSNPQLFPKLVDIVYSAYKEPGVDLDTEEAAKSPALIKAILRIRVNPPALPNATKNAIVVLFSMGSSNEAVKQVLPSISTALTGIDLSGFSSLSDTDIFALRMLATYLSGVRGAPDRETVIQFANSAQPVIRDLILPKLNQSSSPLGASEERAENRARASSPAAEAPERKGGIDFNPNLFETKILRDPNGLPLPIEQQLPTINLQIEGFIPVIIERAPVNIPLLLGLNDSAPAPEKQPDSTPRRSMAVELTAYRKES